MCLKKASLQLMLVGLRKDGGSGKMVVEREGGRGRGKGKAAEGEWKTRVFLCANITSSLNSATCVCTRTTEYTHHTGTYTQHIQTTHTHHTHTTHCHWKTLGGGDRRARWGLGGPTRQPLPSQPPGPK